MIAETCHLVFATLHTNDAPQSLDRISDMFPSDRALVREGKTHQIRNILAAGRSEGMCTLETWLNHLVANGLITYEDAVARSMHPKEIKPAAVAAAG